MKLRNMLRSSQFKTVKVKHLCFTSGSTLFLLKFRPSMFFDTSRFEHLLPSSRAFGLPGGLGQNLLNIW